MNKVVPKPPVDGNCVPVWFSTVVFVTTGIGSSKILLPSDVSYIPSIPLKLLH